MQTYFQETWALPFQTCTFIVQIFFASLSVKECTYGGTSQFLFMWMVKKQKQKTTSSFYAMPVVGSGACRVTLNSYLQTESLYGSYVCRSWSQSAWVWISERDLAARWACTLPAEKESHPCHDLLLRGFWTHLPNEPSSSAHVFWGLVVLGTQYLVKKEKKKGGGRQMLMCQFRI